MPGTGSMPARQRRAGARNGIRKDALLADSEVKSVKTTGIENLDSEMGIKPSIGIGSVKRKEI